MRGEEGEEEERAKHRLELDWEARCRY